MAVHRPAGSGTIQPQLWAFSNTTAVVVHAWSTVTSTWTARTLIDTPTGSGSPIALTFNDKFYLAYENAENRLHLWDGTAVRRVGLIQPAAPTIANTGAGAYAATARQYRIAFLIKSGSDVVVMSELSAAVSFTPSGAGTAARITKSTTVDSATHWRIYALISTAGDTYDLYEDISGDIAVATTTYDDSVNPSAYDGDAPPALGLHIPPPSWKFMITDGNRLIGAGAWKTSSAAGETVPKTSRVWFTRVLGSSDIGDDETIPNTASQKNWIDVGQGDGDIVVGLGGPIDGIVYVVKTRRIYRLIPTGIDTVPYRIDPTSIAVGALDSGGTYAHRNIVHAGQELYFQARSGAHRLSPAYGVQYVGLDISDSQGLGPVCKGGAYNPDLNVVAWVASTVSEMHVFYPPLAEATREGWRGGWGVWNPAAFSTPSSLVMFEPSGELTQQFLTLGGAHAGSAKIDIFSSAAASDSGGTYIPRIDSAPLLAAGGHKRLSAAAPVFEADVNAAATPTLTYVMDYGRESRAATVPVLTQSGNELRKIHVVEGLEAADVAALQVRLQWDTDQTNLVDAVVVRYKEQEPL
jgi:hypothetical protein